LYRQGLGSPKIGNYTREQARIIDESVGLAAKVFRKVAEHEAKASADPLKLQ
jgi:hypothetical protein